MSETCGLSRRRVARGRRGRTGGGSGRGGSGGCRRGGALGALGERGVHVFLLILILRRLLARALAVLLGLLDGDEEVRVALAARVVLVEDDAEVGVLVDGQLLLFLHVVHLTHQQSSSRN
jgi:hypothetical protein